MRVIKIIIFKEIFMFLYLFIYKERNFMNLADRRIFEHIKNIIFVKICGQRDQFLKKKFYDFLSVLLVIKQMIYVDEKF